MTVKKVVKKVGKKSPRKNPKTLAKVEGIWGSSELFKLLTLCEEARTDLFKKWTKGGQTWALQYYLPVFDKFIKNLSQVTHPK